MSQNNYRTGRRRPPHPTKVTGAELTDCVTFTKCPRCLQPLREACTSPSGIEAREPHQERRKLYREQIGEEEWNKRHSALHKRLQLLGIK